MGTLHTLSFIGSDKNAGKTTVLNFVYSAIREQKGHSYPICVTSIGLNGESIDNYEDTPKPSIAIEAGGYFVTAAEHLKLHTGRYEIDGVFPPPEYRKHFILARALSRFYVVLEGPNDRSEAMRLKRALGSHFQKGHLLIDGSIDRQFIAHPDVSDEFYFALLCSDRREQLQKARDLLQPLALATSTHLEMLNRLISPATKSILFDEQGDCIHHGTTIPFLDETLKHLCEAKRSEAITLYLNGALSKSLYSILAPYEKLTVVLDNFTLYQNISVHEASLRPFRPLIQLRHRANVSHIFVKEEFDLSVLPIPPHIPVHNLFREGPHEIRI